MTAQSLIREQLYSYRYYVSIAAAISIVCQQLYKRAFGIPKELQHIPSIPFWRQVLSMVRCEHIGIKTKRLVIPLIEKTNGIYLNRFPMDWTIYVTNPVLAKSILFKPEFQDKTPALLHALGENHPFVDAIGLDSIAIVNGDKWKDQRKIMNPAFHRSMPVQLFGELMSKVFKVIDDTELKGDHVVMVKLTQRLTLEALGKAAFGCDFGVLDREDTVWMRGCTQVLESLLDPLTFFPKINKVFQWFSRSRREKWASGMMLSNLLGEMAEQRRHSLFENKQQQSQNVPDSEKDLLALMLEAEMREGTSFTKEELRHNMGALFFAGLDTTSNALTFALYSLAVHKDIQRKAREEVLYVLGDSPGDILPTIEDCKKLSYVDMIIKEGLRIYSEANILPARTVATDVNLGGIMIPKGSMIAVDIQALHHHPDVWEDPERFDPERFADSGEHSKHEGVTWMPFGGGSRQCLGLNFSMMEQRVALAMLLRRYEWELPTGSIHQNGIIFEDAANVAPHSLKLKFDKRY